MYTAMSSQASYKYNVNLCKVEKQATMGQILTVKKTDANNRPTE